MDFLDIFVKYWLQWVFGLIAAGIAFGAKHYITLQKKSWQDKWDDKIKKDVIEKLEAEILSQEKEFKQADNNIYAEIEALSAALENATIGILSIQSKMFQDECRRLLDPNHTISLDEYEQFNKDYEAYKALGGNHRGDVLYKSVVAKFEASLK